LKIWSVGKEARKFVGLIYELKKNDRFKKDFELVGQIKRSSISSMANTCPVK